MDWRDGVKVVLRVRASYHMQVIPVAVRYAQIPLALTGMEEGKEL